jgi:hypothetical protein
MKQIIAKILAPKPQAKPVPASFVDYSQFNQDALLANRYDGPEGW